MSTRDLLIELGTEELPPKALPELSAAFTDGVVKGLAAAGLAHGEVKGYAAPRRLAILIRDLVAQEPVREVQKRGPAIQAAFDADGRPTRAAEGFARSVGASVDQLERLQTDKGEWLAFNAREGGRPTVELVPGLVQTSLDQLPTPRRMRWGAGSVEFVRPVHWLVLLFGDEVIPARILGVNAGRETRGHRFHHPAPIAITAPADYAALLESPGHVIADFDARRASIRGQVETAARAEGAVALIDAGLLDEVTALNEWPNAIVGGFDARFLEVPSEALISSMQEHQRYFPLVDDQGRLRNRFITIANIASADPDKVRDGNERVIRPRLTDAVFFFAQDRKRPLVERREQLGRMVFQKRLGTLADKSARVSALAGLIAERLNADSGLARRAAHLAKCDLVTSMVFEFPELQGIMGRYYALHDGEPGEVAEAIREQYLPRFAGDQLPATPAGQALALAERLDTLVGIFAIGQVPSGAKDPFALRRAALGVLRIIIERGLDLDLRELLGLAAAGQPAGIDGMGAVDDVEDFLLERLRAYYNDLGITGDAVEAVREVHPTRPLDFDRRVRAVAAFRGRGEAESLAAANKRIGNILRRSEEELPDAVDPDRLVEEAERALANAMGALEEDIETLAAAGDYTETLARLAGLREVVDAFFDGVMVNAEDPGLRANRLALLARLRGHFLRVADLGLLQWG